LILVDANVLMYAAGAEHQYRARSAAFLARVVDGDVQATIDAEVLQEILHRYRAINRWHDGRRLYDTARIIFPSAIPITDFVLDDARRLMDEHHGITARGAIHAAVVRVHVLDAICSFAQGFDSIPSVKRIEP